MKRTDDGTLRVLGWDELCLNVASFTQTPWGKEAALATRPVPDAQTYGPALTRVSECLSLRRLDLALPMRRVKNIDPLLRRAAAEGAHLDGEDLLAAADFFALVSDLSLCASDIREAAPHVFEILDRLVPAQTFRLAVEKAIETDGTVRDNASPELRRLRRSITGLQSSILQKLNHIAAGLGKDSVVTMRDGRHVVSVVEHDRKKVPGVVHDRSGSGATYFVEPLAVMDMGNDLRGSERDLQTEIIRILTDLTSRLRDVLGDARVNIEGVRELDLLWARARWAERHGACVPTRADTPKIELKSARHPLLLSQQLDSGADLEAARKAIVPFSIALDGDARAIVISGPNTGGKTVCLKTVGLCVLMVQAGMPITAEADSIVGTVDTVFADIGDEQSLALSLSTFSSHLKRVGAACRLATSRSLVLLDEIGVGTDPEEGSALARAVILSLVRRGSRVLVTTHYNALKLLSEEEPGIENAAYLFDEDTLSPTYELVVGLPGASYALDIATRMSFPQEIVEEARKGLGGQAVKLASLLARLAEQEIRMSDLEREMTEKQARLDTLIEVNRLAEIRWERMSKSADAEARREARQIVDTTRKETELLVARIRKTKADSASVKQAHRKLRELSQDVAPLETLKTPARHSLVTGMTVRVQGIARDGEITQIQKDGQRITVAIGQMNYTVASDEVEPVEGTQRSEAAKSSQSVTPSSDAYDLDLRGKTVDEAKIELEDLIDVLRQQGMSSLQVIHGRGTGVLRRELTMWFRSHASIESFRRGEQGEGGDGVTVLTLKSL